MLDELAVAKCMVEDFILLVNGLGVDLAPHGVHHTELDLSSQVGGLISAGVFQEQSHVSLVSCLPSVGIHLQSPLGHLAVDWDSELIRVHGLPGSEVHCCSAELLDGPGVVVDDVLLRLGVAPALAWYRR